MAAGNLIAGKYCSTDSSLPWDQHVDLDIIYDEQPTHRWSLRYNDRKYVQAPTATLEVKKEDDGIISGFSASFPHWITRGTVRVTGSFSVNGKHICIHLAQVGQGMTGQEKWSKRLVKKGDVIPDAPSSLPPSLVDLIRTEFSAHNAQPTKPRLDALAISKNGKIVMEEYYGGMTPSTQHIISSCTKSITAILAGIAIDQGLFGLDDIIADYFPDVPTTWRESPPVLVRHVLSMTAGTEHTKQDSQDLLESTDVETLVLGWSRVAPAGQRYNYDNGLPSLIGCLIERTSGIPLADFAKKHLFRLLGITSALWTDMPPTRRPYVSSPPVLAAGGMALTLLDFLKLGQMLVQNGVYEEHRIVSGSFLAEATCQQTPDGDYPYGFYFHVNQKTTGSNKEWAHLDGMDGYLMLGQGEQVLFIAPEEQLAVAAFSSTWHRDGGQPGRYAVMDCIKEALACIGH